MEKEELENKLEEYRKIARIIYIDYSYATQRMEQNIAYFKAILEEIERKK